MSEKTITQQAYDKAVEAMGTAGEALKGKYENVRGYIDINDDGSVTLRDAAEGYGALADNVKAGLGTLKEELSDKASRVYKAAFGDGKEDEGLWGAFKKNPINMVMAGVGALLAGLLFAESGMIGLIIAAVVGAVAFGGLSTYLTQPHEDPHASPSPAGTSQPAAGTEPAVAQGLGLNVDLADGKTAADVVSDGKIEATELKDASNLPAGKVLLTERKDPSNLGAVVLAKPSTDAEGKQVYSDVEVALPDGRYMKLKDPVTFEKDNSVEEITRALISRASGHDAIAVTDKSAINVDDFVKPLSTPSVPTPTGPAAGTSAGPSQ